VHTHVRGARRTHALANARTRARTHARQRTRARARARTQAEPEGKVRFMAIDRFGLWLLKIAQIGEKVRSNEKACVRARGGVRASVRRASVCVHVRVCASVRRASVCVRRACVPASSLLSLCACVRTFACARAR
jgi:hypothetical protein